MAIWTCVTVVNKTRLSRQTMGPWGILSTFSMFSTFHFLFFHFLAFKKNRLRTNWPTDTSSYRDGWTYLKNAHKVPMYTTSFTNPIPKRIELESPGCSGFDALWVWSFRNFLYEFARAFFFFAIVINNFEPIFHSIWIKFVKFVMVINIG